MILVSGTGRSGTSLWMQLLKAAGVTVVGEAFPRDWEQRLGQANPYGFYESTLIHGINFTTNPDPRTKAKLEPDAPVAVKVFSWGIRRTERAYLDKVLVSVRHWRGFCESFARLDLLDRGPAAPPVPDPALFWFREHIALARDAHNRGYSVRFVPFEPLRSHPESALPTVLEWLGLDADIAGTAWLVRRCEAVQEVPGTARERALDQLYAALSEGNLPTARTLDHLEAAWTAAANDPPSATAG